MKLKIAAILLASVVTNHAGTIEVPEVLRSTGAKLTVAGAMVTFVVDSKTPLTPAQWDAVEAAKPTRVQFHGNSLDDAGMARLAKINPNNVFINGNTVLTGAGVAKFGEMSALTTLSTVHARQATPEAKAAFAKHPALESFTTQADFCIEALYAPKLKSATLDHGSANDASIATLANHPTLEALSLGRYTGSKMTDACFTNIATIKHLKKLQVHISTHTYQGLRALKALPALTTLELNEVVLPAGDLEKLKADLPNVKITHTEMTQKTIDRLKAAAGQK